MKKILKHLDLFSGIGGFALATEMVWENVEHTFCDIEPFSQAILKKHWPNSEIYGDIRTLTADSYLQRYLHRGSKEQPAEGHHEAQRKPVAGVGSSALQVDLLTGGFPCQPFSQAGKRRGTEDDRHLWPEMLRVIREFHPRWVVGENVGGFVTWSDGMVLEQVHADLEGEGYEVQAFIVPAVSVNAPHRRDRVWIAANDTSKRRNEWRSERKGQQRGSASVGTNSADAPNSENSYRGSRQHRGQEKAIRASRDNQLRGSNSTTRNTAEQGLEGPRGSRARLARESGRTGWEENWLEVATRLCVMDDGLPNGLARPDGSGDAQKLPRPKGWRNAALKGAGNAIVPQVAMEIFKAIKLCDKSLQ